MVKGVCGKRVEVVTNNLVYKMYTKAYKMYTVEGR